MKKSNPKSKPRTVKPELYKWYWVYYDDYAFRRRKINKRILVKWLNRIGEHFGDGCYYRKRWLVFEIDSGYQRNVEGIDFRIAREATRDELQAVAKKAIANAAEIASERIPHILGTKL